jgi:hypothetical protein
MESTSLVGYSSYYEPSVTFMVMVTVTITATVTVTVMVTVTITVTVTVTVTSRPDYQTPIQVFLYLVCSGCLSCS